MELVKLIDNQPMTTSLKVAEVFGKEHDDLLRKIQKLSEDVKDVRKNAEMFISGVYRDNYDREQPMYEITRDGFTLLAMGFTGKKALQFKLKYIAAFNKMERMLNEIGSLAPIVYNLRDSHSYEALDKFCDDLIYHICKRSVFLIENAECYSDKKKILKASNRIIKKIPCLIKQ